MNCHKTDSGVIIMLVGLIIGLLSNSIGLWLAQRFVAGFVVIGGLKGYLIAGILLGLLNLVVGPLLKVISLPLMILTLGLFGIIINIALIWIVARATGYIIIQSWEGLLLATVVLAAVNLVSHLFSQGI